MMKSWHPNIDARGRLLRGPAARVIALLQEWAAYLGGVLLAVLIVGMLVTGKGYGETGFLVLIMLAILIDALIFVPILLVASHLRKRAEVRAGYTTVTNQFPEVDQIDPQSGRVVRLAGEDTLNRDQYLERLGKIREFHSRG